MKEDFSNIGNGNQNTKKYFGDVNKPEISVIIPIYNVAPYLEKCLNSVINQTYTNFEVICVNDGSTDKSQQIAERFVKEDSRIKLISQSNKGLSSARNTAMEKAVGKYIVFLDSDDFYAPDFLQVMYDVQQKTKSDIVGCDFMKIKDAEDILPEVSRIKPVMYQNALNVLLHKHNFIHFNVWNKLYTRNVIGNIRFVPDMYYEDWVFNCCVFEKAGSFVWVKEKLYGYRLSNSSIMRSAFNEKKLNDYIRGIQEVAKYFQQNAPEKWDKVRRTRISRTVKMMLNSARRSKNTKLQQQTGAALQKLKADNLITYQGLSLLNKIKLYLFLKN